MINLIFVLSPTTLYYQYFLNLHRNTVNLVELSYTATHLDSPIFPVLAPTSGALLLSLLYLQTMSCCLIVSHNHCPCYRIPQLFQKAVTITFFFFFLLLLTLNIVVMVLVTNIIQPAITTVCLMICYNAVVINNSIFYTQY